MKYLILLAALIIAGCGSDNPVNNNTGNPPVSNAIFAVDSISARIALTPVYVKDTIKQISNNNVDSLKVTFTVETNCLQSQNPSAVFTLSSDTLGSTATYLVNEVSNFNREHIFYCKTFNTDYSLKFSVSLSPSSPLGNYVKASNIKVELIQ